MNDVADRLLYTRMRTPQGAELVVLTLGYARDAYLCTSPLWLREDARIWRYGC